jgi:hypothetical protein
VVALADTPGSQRSAASAAVDAVFKEWWVAPFAAGWAADYERFLARLDGLRHLWGLLVQLAEGGPVTPPPNAKAVPGGFEVRWGNDPPLFIAGPSVPGAPPLAAPALPME